MVRAACALPCALALVVSLCASRVRVAPIATRSTARISRAVTQLVPGATRGPFAASSASVAREGRIPGAGAQLGPSATRGPFEVSTASVARGRRAVTMQALRATRPLGQAAAAPARAELDKPARLPRLNLAAAPHHEPASSRPPGTSLASLAALTGVCLGLAWLGKRATSVACSKSRPVPLVSSGQVPLCQAALASSRQPPRVALGAMGTKASAGIKESTGGVDAVADSGGGKPAVVVGAGVGGLCMAGRLQRAGYSVTLLERMPRGGGRMNSAETKLGYRFDTGPSLLLFPDKYRDAFKALGRNFDDYVSIVKVTPPYRIHYGEDHTSLDLSYDCEEMKATCESVEPGSSMAYFQWLAAARASLDLGVKAFIERDCTSILDFVNPALVLPLALAVNPLELLLPQQFQMGRYFKSQKLKALFSYQELYVGLTPYNAPGVFSLLAATEITDGVWYPKGGFQTVRDALVKICEEEGVNIRFETEVEDIITAADPSAPNEISTNGEKVSGVRLSSGEQIDAGLIVCNADIPVAYEKYLKGSRAATEAKSPNPYAPEASRMDEMEYSCSVINFCWSLKGVNLTGLRHHNVFLSGDYEGSWQRPCLVEDFKDGVQHNFYVHRPKASDPSCVPGGSLDSEEESIMVLLPVGNMAEVRKRAAAAGVPPPSMEDIVSAGRESVLRRFEASGHGDLRSAIVEETVIDPSEWERAYNMKHGAVFGLSHGLLQLACFRPPTKTQLPNEVWPETPVPDGLHFVGASTRPGNGVPLVMMGAAVEFENIIKQHGYGSSRTHSDGGGT